MLHVLFGQRGRTCFCTSNAFPCYPSNSFKAATRNLLGKFLATARLNAHALHLTAAFCQRTPINPALHHSSSALNMDCIERNVAKKSSQKVAVVQMTATNNKAANFNVCTQLIRKAYEQGAELVCLPECFHFIGHTSAEALSVAAESLDGPTITNYRSLARELGIWISLGGFQEKIIPPTKNEAEKIYNTHILIDGSGQIQETYRKIHLFDVPKLGLEESKFTRRGEAVADPIDSPVGKIGLSICYDLRFPELYTHLAAQGAELLLVPSAFTFSTGSAHWETLLRARAIETQCYVLAAAQVGKHNEKRESWGHACIIDPWGQIVAQCSDPLTPPSHQQHHLLSGSHSQDTGKISVTASGEIQGDICFATISQPFISRVRERIPVQLHRERRREHLGNILH